MIEIIECDGVKEQLEQQRPDYIRFYAAWKRIVMANGWQTMAEHFLDDAPSQPNQNSHNRVCTVGQLRGPGYDETFRVHYNVKQDDRVYVLELGDNLSVDNIKN